MTKRLSLSLCLALMAIIAIAADTQPLRQTTRLSEGWKFAFGNAADPAKDFGCGTEYFNYFTKAASIHNEGPYSFKFDDSAWQEVRIPHDWVTTLPYANGASHSHGYKTVGYKYPETSVGWYRKVLNIPAEKEGRHISLQFDGIFRNAQVWFNGFFLGTEPSGYATQVYDITDYIKYGEDNLICVRADATFEEGWFYEGAGIYRDAWLVEEPLVHVAPFGVFAYAEFKDADLQHARLHFTVDVENSSSKEVDFKIRESLYDAEGKLVKQSWHELKDVYHGIQPKQTITCPGYVMTIDSPHLWDIDDPYLYTLRTEIFDRTTNNEHDAPLCCNITPIGIRHIEFRADTGFWLNGRNIKLKGLNIHQDHAGVGAAIPDALQAWRIKQLKSIGCNAYRASHNPMTPALLDVCDQEGILVIDENRLCGVNNYHKGELENMIRRDRNHPSIIMWSDGNEEWGMENTVQGRRVAASMREMTKLLDPSRPSCIANAGGGEMIKGLDVVGYNYIRQNHVMERREQHPDWKIVGTEETSGCGTRGVYAFDEKHPGRMPSLNRNPQTPDWKLNKAPGAGLRNTAESGTQGIERGWQFYADTPWAAGCFFWTGFDYRGEPNPLSFPAHDSEFGVLDYCGFWKDEAYYLKAAWTDEPTLHILPHWNLAVPEGEEVDVWVYSNCDEVALTVNGKNLGRKKMLRNGHLTWTVPYKKGRVIATGYKNGKKIITDVVETTGPADRLILTADRSEYKADGRDVAVVNISVVDKKGREVPDACPDLTFTLEGDARIIGAGNGDPECPVLDNPAQLNCKSFRFPAFNGKAQLLVQTTENPGTITLRCNNAAIELQTK